MIEELLYLESSPEWVQWEKILDELMKTYSRRRGTWSQLHHLNAIIYHLNNKPEVSDDSLRTDG